MYHPVSYAAGRLQRFSTAKGLGNYYRDEYTHGSGPTDAFVYAHQKRAATYNTPPPKVLRYLIRAGFKGSSCATSYIIP